MNAIIFYNRNGNKKLAILTDSMALSDLDSAIYNAMNLICADNDYSFQFVYNIDITSDTKNIPLLRLANLRGILN